jgi:hypothetical protein
VVDFYTTTLTQPKRGGALPRDDYKELCLTSLAPLEGELPGGGPMVWSKPGPTHKARFMGYSLCSNKFYAFFDQLGYDSGTKAALQRFTTFNTLVYTPYFLKSSIGADAPVNDLALYKLLFFFRSIDSDLAESALRVLRRHGWYLR